MNTPNYTLYQVTIAEKMYRVMAQTRESAIEATCKDYAEQFAPVSSDIADNIRVLPLHPLDLVVP